MGDSLSYLDNFLFKVIQLYDLEQEKPLVVVDSANGGS